MCMLHDRQRSSDQTATPLFNAVKTKLAASVLKSRRGGVRMGLLMVMVGGKKCRGAGSIVGRWNVVIIWPAFIMIWRNSETEDKPRGLRIVQKASFITLKAENKGKRMKSAGVKHWVGFKVMTRQTSILSMKMGRGAASPCWFACHVVNHVGSKTERGLSAVRQLRMDVWKHRSLHSWYCEGWTLTLHQLKRGDCIGPFKLEMGNSHWWEQESNSETKQTDADTKNCFWQAIVFLV